MSYKNYLKHGTSLSRYARDHLRNRDNNEGDSSDEASNTEVNEKYEYDSDIEDDVAGYEFQIGTSDNETSNEELDEISDDSLDDQEWDVDEDTIDEWDDESLPRTADEIKLTHTQIALLERNVKPTFKDGALIGDLAVMLFPMSELKTKTAKTLDQDKVSWMIGK